MLVGLIVALVLWLTVITILVTPAATYSNLWDKVTEARFRQDRINLDIMLDHLRKYPDQWSITREQVSFPAEGAKQIYLSYDKHSDLWHYSLSSFDSSGVRPLNGYFGKLFKEEIDRTNNRREAQSLLRNFYPDLNSEVLLLK